MQWRNILTLFAALAASAPADTFCVANSGELQGALTASAFNLQNDVILITQGTYQGNFAYVSLEDNDLTLRGGYVSGCGSRVLDPANTVLDGMNAGPTLILSSTQTSIAFEVEGLTIENGNATDAAGGIHVANQAFSLIVNKCRLLNNRSTYGYIGYYAGLYAYVTNSVSVTETSFTGNDGNGMTLYATPLATGTIRDCVFSDNTGVGAYAAWEFYAAALVFSGNTVTHNQGGGAVLGWASPSTALTVTLNSFVDNTASENGGGLNVYGGTMTIEDNEFRLNRTLAHGGGLFLGRGGPALLNRNSFLENTAGAGGGLSSWYTKLTLDNSTFVGNTASTGGGLYFDGNTVLFDTSLIARNNLIARNQAQTSMGAGGGGIFIDSWSPQALTNNTITGNTAPASRGGGLYMRPSEDYTVTEIYNNIIWNNSSLLPGGDLAIDNDGNNNYIPSVVDLYHNDFDQSATGAWFHYPFPIHASNLNNANPMFVNAPGDDYHLQAGSPVISAGDNSAPELPLVDHDGGPRIRAALVDMGAYEYPTPGPIPDLTMTAFTGPVYGLSTAAVRLSATVKDQGDLNAGAFRIGFYLSPEPIISTTDTFLGYCNISGVAAGGSRTCQAAPVIPGTLPAGTYYLGAFADYVNAIWEANETNNARTSDAGLVQVTGGPCLLNVALAYDGTNLQPAFDLATLRPMRWSVALVTHNGATQILRRDLPAVSAVTHVTFPIALTPQGNVAVVTALTEASGGIQCFDYATVNTGGTGLSLTELFRMARQAGYPVR